MSTETEPTMEQKVFEGVQATILTNLGIIAGMVNEGDLIGAAIHTARIEGAANRLDAWLRTESDNRALAVKGLDWIKIGGEVKTASGKVVRVARWLGGEYMVVKFESGATRTLYLSDLRPIEEG